LEQIKELGVSGQWWGRVAQLMGGAGMGSGKGGVTAIKHNHK